MIPFAHLDDRRIDDDDHQTLDPTTQSKISFSIEN